MTKQHKKILWICVGIIVASYIVRNIVIGAMQIAFYQRQMAFRAAQQRQRSKPKPVVKAPSPAPKPAPDAPATEIPAPTKVARAPVHIQPIPVTPSPFVKVSGIWRGRVALDGRGVCDLKFELHEESPGHFSGYSTMTCNSAGQLMPDRKVNARMRTLNLMDPETAILTGTLEKGSIEFHVEKTINADSNGCAPTSFSLTPFGANQLAAEWLEGACGGGHLILRRARG
jgi:hypothetical protein